MSEPTVRDRLAEALADWFGMENPIEAAVALLPLVEQLRAEAKAEALWDAATALQVDPLLSKTLASYVSGTIRDRVGL